MLSKESQAVAEYAEMIDSRLRELWNAQALGKYAEDLFWDGVWDEIYADSASTDATEVK